MGFVCTVTALSDEAAVRAGSAGVFKRLCARSGVLLMHGRPTTTQWLLRVHTHTHARAYMYNMYKTEFARIARESIVFSWHPPAVLPVATRHRRHRLPTRPPSLHIQHTRVSRCYSVYIHLVSRISPSPYGGGGGGVLPFSVDAHRETDTIRQRSPTDDLPSSREQTLFHSGFSSPAAPIGVNSKYSPVYATHIRDNDNIIIYV